ncbi:MAG: GH3 auxin-responsive promoter family protein [Cyclobacteriaceae bacterium]|nr:GH3 auxin-responsive promoter family protein [Cyclobacteriaceae bacterium]
MQIYRESPHQTFPSGFSGFTNPAKEISGYDDWNRKLDRIVDRAKKWDIGIIVGVPAWIQMLLERIISKYKLKNIHEIWPNLCVYVHGGVAFEPYQNSFNKLLGKRINYIQTYLASEGFIAYQSKPHSKSMKLVLNNGIFYEFIPFNDQNFDSDGNLKRGAVALLIDEVQKGTEYALLITTCAGAWRYLIGDVVRFTDAAKAEIVITGRTKHFLSLCGEHLSVDNMNRAVELVENELDIEIREYTVTGMPQGTAFIHKWYVGCDNEVEVDLLRQVLDEKLKMLNDDYRIERSYALKEVQVHKIPLQNFYNWLKINGKEGGQSKFPRVLKGDRYLEWVNFLNNHAI